MNNATGQSRILWAAVVAMVTLSLWLLLAWRTDSEAQAAKQKQGSYEYGRLRIKIIDQFSVFQSTGNSVYQWQTRKSIVTTNSAEELYRKLGGKGSISGADTVAVMDLLAENGWELVTHTHSQVSVTNAGGEGVLDSVHFYTFRRRR